MAVAVGMQVDSTCCSLAVAAAAVGERVHGWERPLFGWPALFQRGKTEPEERGDRETSTGGVSI